MPLSPAIDILDEGVSQGTVSALDFTGAGVSASVSGAVATVNIAGGVTDHGALTGLADDDHAQYLLASAAGGRAAFASNWTDLTDGGNTTLHTHDHGVLSGLTDDDHTQYASLDGRSGGQTLTGSTVSGQNLTLRSNTNDDGLVVVSGVTNDTTAALKIGPVSVAYLELAPRKIVCTGGILVIDAASSGDRVDIATQGSTRFSVGPLGMQFNLKILGNALTVSQAAWGTIGAQASFAASTITDTDTAGTRGNAVNVSIAAPTFAATNAVTITDAATLYISGAPVAGTNVTNTNSWAIWVDDGPCRFDGGARCDGGLAVGTNVVSTTQIGTSTVFTDTSGSLFGANLGVFSNPGSNSTAVITGAQVTARITNGNVRNHTGQISGGTFSAVNQGASTGVATFLVGGQFIAQTTNTGTTTTAFSGYFLAPTNSGSGTVTNAVTLVAAEVTSSISSKNTNVLIGTITVPTGSWSIYNASTKANHFAGNLGIGATSFGTSATNTLALLNGTEPGSSPADMVQIYSVDLSAGNATLGLRTETAVVTETVTSDRTLSVKINGTTYKICLKS